jgi:hypothetical protein
MPRATTKSCSVSLGLAVSAGRSGLTSAVFAAFVNAQLDAIRRPMHRRVRRLKTRIIADHLTCFNLPAAVAFRDVTARREANCRNGCGRCPTLFCQVAGGTRP